MRIAAGGTAAIAAIVLTGCGDVAGHSTSATSADSSTSAARVVADPCADAGADCTPIGHVDIDGDGTLDAVGISVVEEAKEDPRAFSGPSNITVAVATSDGTRDIAVKATAAFLLPGKGVSSDVFVGAFAMSRAHGADVVLHTKIGQGDSDRFVVIGWQDDNLVVVPPPPVVEASNSDPRVWYLQESHGTQKWVTCEAGTVTVVTKSAPSHEGIPLPGGGIRQSDHWRFDNGTWTPNGSDNVADQDFSYDFNAHTDAFKCDNLMR